MISKKYKSIFNNDLCAKPSELWSQIISSVVPQMKRRNVDLLGPAVAFVLLVGLLHYGHAYKLSTTVMSLPPLLTVLVYALVMPALVYFLVRLAQGRIHALEAITLIGYGLFGHVFTLATSLLLRNQDGNALFYCCLILFGGSSALRLAISLLLIIPHPAARLIVCSVVATLQLLSLIFLHFAYMHPTFKYGHGA